MSKQKESKAKEKAEIAKFNIQGKALFDCTRKEATYKGKSTGKYTLTIVIDEDTAEQLSELGVTIKSLRDDPYAVTLETRNPEYVKIGVINEDGQAVDLPADVPIGNGSRVTASTHVFTTQHATTGEDCHKLSLGKVLVTKLVAYNPFNDLLS